MSAIVFASVTFVMAVLVGSLRWAAANAKVSVPKSQLPRGASTSPPLRVAKARARRHYAHAS